jgi:hypothetical protein
MEKIVNAYTVISSELRPGDTMLFVLKAIVMRDGRYRIYRCPYEAHGDIPQGSRVYDETAVAEAIFPVLGWAGLRPDDM